MGMLDELSGEEQDELGAHLRVLLGKPASPEMKAAFKAAVHQCMDEYGPEAEPEEEETVPY